MKIGIIKKTKNAKEQTEIANEKEMIELAITQAMTKDRFGKITKEGLEEHINKNIGEGKTQVIDDGDMIVVKFVESNRYYEIDSQAYISEPIEIEEIEYAGDLTKGGIFDGSEEKPFKIDCIEDLVAFSIMTNGGNSALGISANNFLNKYVELNRTLDFKSVFSYGNYTTTFYGDLNGDAIIEDLRTELTKTNEGCKGFTAIKTFMGIFDGKENMIKNIYQKVDSGNVGLALFVTPSKEIKNLSISGTIINNTWHAAGIAVHGSAIISNCKNYANITGYNMVGGMKDWLTGGKIFNCINYGTITITGKDYQYGAAGGIAGAVKGNLIIENCVNEGDVNGEITRAGIVGYANEANIRNCINKGKSSAGIVSWIGPGTTNIINCYNLGECNNGLVNSFTGAAWNSILELNIKNSYNLGKVSNSGIIGAQGTTCAKITLNIENCYNAGSSDNAILGKVSYDTKTETAINITNTYYDTTKSVSVGIIEDGITGLSETEIKNNTSFIEKLNNNIGTNAEWKKWEIGKDGYPTFE